MRLYLVILLFGLSACGATAEVHDEAPDEVQGSGPPSTSETSAPRTDGAQRDEPSPDVEAGQPEALPVDRGDTARAEDASLGEERSEPGTSAVSDAGGADVALVPETDATPASGSDTTQDDSGAEESESQGDVGDASQEVGADVLNPPAGPASMPPSTFLPPVDRLVAIGDVHGDINALRSALSVAMVIDSQDNWVGGATTVVQVGDQLDRGDDEREILDWLEVLSEQARSAGGAVYPLLGNHEVMNVELNLNYITAGGFTDFADVPWDPSDPLYAAYPDDKKGRVAAFRPGGPYALILARHALALVVGDTLFVHGGVLPEHVAYGLDAINSETRAWMKGEAPHPSILSGSNSPVWSRHYSNAPDDADCALLSETLNALDISRIVVAHTVQEEGITSACQDQAWRVDVGLASYYGGPTQILLIEGTQVSVLP